MWQAHGTTVAQHVCVGLVTTYYACVDAVCAMGVCVGGYGSVDLCVSWHPTFQLSLRFSLLCLLLPYHTIRIHRPSSSQALYFVAGTRYNSSCTASLCGPGHHLLTMRVLTWHMHVCATGVCVGVYGSVDLFVCWHHSSAFFLV